MNIYWTSDIIYNEKDYSNPESIDMSLALLPPEPLSKNIPGNIRDSLYSRCPAFTDIMKNTFVIKCPFDFSLKIELDTNRIECEERFKPLIKTFIVQPYKTENLYQYYTHLHFFADSPCEAHEMSPFLHNNSLTRQTSVLHGQFNIHKWYRPFNTAFIPTTDKKYLLLEMKRGDIISYIRFHTEEKIKLTEFINSQEIQNIANQCVSFKHARKGIFSLTHAYDSFMQRQRNKQLLKLIKENIVGD